MRMKKITLITILTLLLSTNASFANTCLEKAITQAAMNKCANTNLQKADDELNRVYANIKASYVDDKLFLQKLKEAQREWIKLRDADFELKFPHAKDPSYYGSVFPMCANSYQTQQTLERIAFLKEWLVGTEEGNVCSGSTKVFEEPELTQASTQSCYHKFDGANNVVTATTELFINLVPNSNEITGDYNYYSDKGERRYGTIKGISSKDGVINAKYSFEEKGKKDVVNLEIKIEGSKASIKSEKSNFSAELKKYDCEA